MRPKRGGNYTDSKASIDILKSKTEEIGVSDILIINIALLIKYSSNK